MDSVLTYVESLPQDETDPSLRDGFTQLFENEIPFEIRNQQSAEGPQQVVSVTCLNILFDNIFN